MFGTPDALKAFQSGDPIAGAVALEVLLAQGDAGEESLFSQPIRVPTVQVRRRWLRYVATRPDSTGQRLLARLDDNSVFNDAGSAVDLFAGLPPDHPIHVAVGKALASDFVSGMPSIGPAQDYWRVVNKMYAASASGQPPWTLWQVVSGSSYAWEKLRTHAFRGACAAAARFGRDHMSPVERFFTPPGGSDPWPEVDASELWLQAYRQFPVWQSGSLVDGLFSSWSKRDNPRLRRFAAMILNAVGFRRAQTPLMQWLSHETDPDVRGTLLTALAQCGTRASADAVLTFAANGEPNREAIAVGAQHASDRTAAARELESIAAGEDFVASEALVSLARMGIASSALHEALFASDDYRRLNAALAVGILKDRSWIDDLLALRAESSGVSESLYVHAALTMLGCEDASALHQRMCHFASGYVDGGELFQIKPALKQAVLTAFERAGPEGRTYLDAWKAEMAPLDAVAKPVVLASTPATSRAVVASPPSATAPSDPGPLRQVPARFRVAFSFAGAQRVHVRTVAEAVESRLGRGLVFLDDWFQAYVAGIDADILLQRIYLHQSDLVVVCVSGSYDDRPWTLVEHRAVRSLGWGAKAGSRQALRLLPLRFGDGDVEGIPVNAIVPDVRGHDAAQVAELILERLRLSER